MRTTVKPVSMLDRLLELERGGASLFQLMEAAQLRPKHDLAAGDWRNVAFDGLELDGFNFGNCRLFGASFWEASVREANFRGSEGAIFVRKGAAVGLAQARNWRDAKLEEHQRLVLLYDSHRRSPGQEPLPIDDFIRRGLLSEKNFVDMMRSTGDISLARKIYDAMLAQGLAPNKYALTTLITLTRDWDDRITALIQEAEAGSAVDTVLLNAAASNYRSESAARSVRKLFINHGFVPDEYYYNIMIDRAKTPEQAMRYLTEMSSAEVRPSRVTMNTIMMRYSDWQSRRSVIDTMLESQLEIASNDINALLQAAETKQQVAASLQILTHLKIEPDISTFNIRIHKRKDMKESLYVLNEMVQANIPPDAYTQKALIPKTTSFEEVLMVMRALKPFQLDIFNDFTITRLARFSPDPNRARTLRQTMDAAGSSGQEQALALVRTWTTTTGKTHWLGDIFGSEMS